MSYEEIRQKIGTSGALYFEYDALISVIPEPLKIEMDDNNLVVIIPRKMNTKLGPLNKLSSKMISFSTNWNNDIFAANVWKQASL